MQERTRRLKLIAMTLVVLFSLCGQKPARAIGSPSTSQRDPDAHRLEPARTIERKITPAQSHVYSITISAGQFLRVIVTQKSIDVTLALEDAYGQPLIKTDLTADTGDREPLSYEAKETGDFRLVVHANPESALSGEYQLQMNLKASADEQDRKRAVAESLLIEATNLSRRMEFQQSIQKEQQALALWRELADREWEGHTLRSIGHDYENLSRYDKAIDHYNQALSITRELKDRRGEASTLSELGFSYDRLGSFNKSLDSFAHALAINQELKRRREEGVGLAWIGWENYRLRRSEKAIEYCQQALAIAREVENRNDEGEAINGIAAAYGGALQQFEKAVEYGEQYLVIERELKSRYGEAAALNNLAIFYRGLLRFDKAIEYYAEALAIFRDLKDRQAEALALRNLGDLYSSMTRLDKAVEYYEQSLVICREIKDRQGEALVLGPMANIYNLLGRPEKSIEYLGVALPINREFKNHLREAANLNGLGNANDRLGNYEKAVEFYEQTLAIAREFKIRQQEGVVLGNLSDEYCSLRNYDKAIEYGQQALAVSRETSSRSSEAHVHHILGTAYREKGQYAEATQHHEQSLRLAREMRSRAIEGEALRGLMLDWQAQNKPGIAVLFGKQAVNLYQEIRGEITSLERESQQSYVKSREGTYRALADLLIAEGRLPEAEQVINLLKQEEYFDFIRRDASNAPQANKAQMTPEEAALEKRYREISDQLTALGAERGKLMDKKSRTPEEDQRLASVDAELVATGNAFQEFFDQLSTELTGTREAGDRGYPPRESKRLMENLRELGNGVVALYTLVGEDKYRVILTTPDFQKGYEYPIKGADLNRKVLEFRKVLQSPKYDPLPLAQELYKILIGPVAADLENSKATVLMWSLDGVLRYLPVSALHDGEQYLVERFNNVVFTPASQERLKDEPAAHWDALGLGVSRQHGERIPALPGVLDEMRGIIRDESVSRESVGKQLGVLPGVVKLDEQFTEEAMLSELKKPHKVVHIASHFQFSPGDETNSALLLGNGAFLSLAQIKALPNVFGGVDLLTLSACNTATGGAGNGKEVEAFGVLAQRLGAKAVVASLWPVADRSTKLLMQEFYRARESHSGTSKIEALREAQMKLLRGEMAVDDGRQATADPAQKSRELAHEEAKPADVNRPLFKSDSRAPFAHPYYWAPFILIGNWR